MRQKRQKKTVPSTHTRSQKNPSWPFKRSDNPVGIALANVDALLDRIRFNKQKKFDEASINQLKKLTSKDLVEVNNKLSLTLEGIKGALSNDAYCKECFSCYDKAQMKLVVEYLKAIKAMKPDANANGKIRAAGQRKKKIKAPELIVKKVLYLEADKETRQTSIHPKELVGASEMWVYNTKTRKLGCYYATGESGLTAKGTTILDYDTERSTTKTIRKPVKQINDFILAGSKFWDRIKAVPQAISPRMNRDTIILRVVRN